MHLFLYTYYPQKTQLSYKKSETFWMHKKINAQCDNTEQLSKKLHPIQLHNLDST